MAEAQTTEAQDTHSLIEQDAVSEIDILRQIAENDGPCTLLKYIKDSMTRWENEQVKFAITGRSSTGKSTFINTIRHLKPRDDGFAKVGSGNTTIRPTLYMHPNNDQIAFYDLPCYSTTIFKKGDYISEMQISDYDFFLIFFDNVLGEDEIWLVGELRKLRKPFSLVRSKIDIDIESAIYNGKEQEMIIPEIKQEIENVINANPELMDTKGTFIISCREPHFDIPNLLKFVEDNIGGLKAQGLLFALESVTKNILERNYKMFKGRLTNITILSSGILGRNVANTPWVTNELHHYINVFKISRADVNSLRDFNQSLLKCKYLLEPSFNVETFVTTHMERAATQLIDPPDNNFIFAAIGSAISSSFTGMVAYKFLHDILEDINHDAMVIYEQALKINAYL